MTSQTPPKKILMKSRMRHKRIAIVLIIPLLVFCRTWWPENRLMHEIMQWTGYFLILAGVGIRIFCSVYIGGQKNEQLMTSGPFSVVRNPLYCGSFIAIVGIGLQTASLILTLVIILLFFLYYPFVVEREEQFLEERFHDKYKRYKENVPRWIPSFPLWESPKEIVVKPYFVGRTILDSFGFILVIPVFELMHNLQDLYLHHALIYLV